MRIVVTGANGFIGKNLCLALSENDRHTVISISRESTTKEFTDALSQADFVFHLAGVNRPKSEDEFHIGNALSTQTLSDALNECRNEVGPVAHGKDGFLDVLYRSQLRTYLLTGDALLALVLGALEGTEPNLQHTREPSESFIRLHNRIDSSALVAASVDDDGEVPVFILSIGTPGLPEGVELRVEPSRLMYALDRGAYVEVLASSTVDLLEDAQSTEAEVPEGASSPAEATSAEVPLVRFTPAYSGKLGGVLSELASYLKTLSLRPDESLVDPDASLAPSLLATAELYMGVDWRDRQSLQSGMRVALIRILSRFGVPMAQAKLNAQHIASWLRIKVTTDLENPTG